MNTSRQNPITRANPLVNTPFEGSRAQPEPSTLVNVQPRINIANVSPDAYKAMSGLERYVRQSGLETSLLELVRLRASQINACAYCIDMHTKDARAAGETEQRLYALNAWRETPFYTPRERAALEWTEALTQIATSGAPDDVFERVRSHFTESELVNLTMAIVGINGWNRIAISFRAVPGSYERPKEAAAPKEKTA